MTGQVIDADIRRWYLTLEDRPRVVQYLSKFKVKELKELSILLHLKLWGNKRMMIETITEYYSLKILNNAMTNRSLRN